MWVRDPKTNKQSATLTVFLVGTAVVLVKFALSGLTIAGIAFEHLGGSDFAFAVGALGAIYWGRKYSDTHNSDHYSSNRPPIEGPSKD